MALLTIDPTMWSDARFATLQETMRWTRAQTLGVVLLMWAATRVTRKEAFSEAEMLELTPGPQAQRHTTLHALLDAGYVTRCSNAWQVRDNAAWHALSAKRQAGGRVAGQARKDRAARRVAQAAPVSPPPTALQLVPAAPKKRGRPRKSPVVPAKTPAQVANAAAWEAYSDAYQRRYQVEPLRNARTNGVIAQIVQRLGAEPAPEVLRFYLRHQDSHYVQRQHDLTLALRDAEALHTQWRRGLSVTRADVRASEGEARLEAQLQRIGALAP